MPRFTESHVRQLCGWRDDPRRHAVAAFFGNLRDVAPRLVVGAPPHAGNTMLYQAWTDVLGHEPEYHKQEIGDCVSHGFGHANDLLQCIEMSLTGSSLEYKETLTEFIYGESRKVGDMLGIKDGSVGAYAIKAATTVGMISREMIPDGDYNGKRAKEWGVTGPPAELEEMAAEYKLGAAAVVRTWTELAVAIDNGYPVTVASDQGFTLTRDHEGICEAEGQWMHQMHICGLIGETAVIGQSWGENVPDGPLVHGMPSFSFRARRPIVEHMLAQGDCWALSKTPSFASRPLPASWSYRSFV